MTMNRNRRGRSHAHRQSPGGAARPARRFACEPLEARYLLSTTVIEVDTFDDVVDPGDGFTSLREAVLAANASPGDEEIRLSAGTYALTIVNLPLVPDEDAGLTGDLDILDNGSLKIVGAAEGETTIDAMGPTSPPAVFARDRVFHVHGGRFEIERLTVTGIRKADSGGAISNVGGHVTISHSTLSGEAKVYGGAVYNGAGGVMTIESSRITHAKAGAAAGIANDIGGELALIDSVVTENDANTGGGIGNGGTMTVMRTIVSSNSAGAAGGVINAFGGRLTIQASTISGNRANLVGGVLNGLLESESTMEIVGSTISQNESDTEGSAIGNFGSLTIEHATITGNRGRSEWGAVIGYDGSSLRLAHTIVAGNIRENGAPSDIYLDGSAAVAPASGYNLIGDPASAGGLVHGANGNIVGDGAGGVLDIAAILNTTLADNGGPTKTHALVAGSPAADAGDPAFNPFATDPPTLFDQRGAGFARVVAGRIDIGAFEAGNLSPGEIVGRHVFYDNSVFDGRVPGVSALDDAAIAPDKAPLFGDLALAGPANVTSYTRGINGLMVDIAGSHPNVSANDFIFRTGNNNARDLWTPPPAPLAVVVRPGAGADGADRVVIVWADGAIRNTYLQVTVAANANTGLTQSDTFFFGNKPGETFTDLGVNFVTSASDEAEVRSHFGAGAAIDNPYDFDRNGFAGASADQFAAREFFGIMPRLAAAVVAPPELSAGLAHDTAPGGAENDDGVTRDPTIAGLLTSALPMTSVYAHLLGHPASVNLMPYLAPDGSFSFNLLDHVTGLSDGTWTIFIEAVDFVGNSAAADVFFAYKTSTAQPTVDLNAADDAGVSSTDDFTNVTTPRIDVTAEIGARVRLYVDGALVREGIGAPGLQFTLDPLAAGTHEIRAVVEDLAGNTSASTVLPIHISTELPSVSVATMATVSADRTPHVRVAASGSVLGLTPAVVPPVIIDVDLNFDGDFDDPGELAYTTSELYRGQAFFQLDTPLPKDVGGSAYYVQIRARVRDDAGSIGASPPVVLKIDALGAPNLEDYVTSTDTPDYTLVRTIDAGSYTYYALDLRSQTWRSAADVNRPEWQHWLQIIVPKGELTSSALLVIDGGGNTATAPSEIPGDIADVASFLADALKSVLVYLPTVPNQSLEFSGDPGHGRSEDAIIAYTFDQFMSHLGEPGNESWPALLPMVQSAVAAMDAVQHFVPTVVDDLQVEDFVVTGYSKRGWTTWLTAAVDDRVRAIIPGVIELLNLGEQMIHHYESYGTFSAWIDDYLAYDIPQESYTPAGLELGRVVDPYMYLDNGRFDDMPKLLMSSSGDEYFLNDATEFYFSDIPGTKNYLRHIPNTGHGLDLLEVAGSTLSFFDAVVHDKPLPEFSWSIRQDGTIVVDTVTAPSMVRLWQATNGTSRDFRHAVHPEIVWQPTTLAPSGPNRYEARVEAPDAGATAYFIELIFPSTAPFGADFAFTTQIKVATNLPRFAWPFFMPTHAPPPAATTSAATTTTAATATILDTVEARRQRVADEGLLQAVRVTLASVEPAVFAEAGIAQAGGQTLHWATPLVGQAPPRLAPASDAAAPSGISGDTASDDDARQPFSIDQQVHDLLWDEDFWR